MSGKTNFIFKTMHIVAWIIFVGICIEAGGLIVNFIFSVYNPGFVQNLYQKLDLSELHNRNQSAFFGIYSFILSIALLKAYLFYLVIVLLYKFDISNPFNTFASQQITNISYFTFSVGLVSYIARETTRNLQQSGYDIDNVSEFWADPQAFILMAAVIYIIATIFKRGVEIQNENDLTV